LIIALGFLGLTFALPAQAEGEECEMLFVEQAKSMTFSAGVMILMEVSPTIIFFCDRPVRTAGHMTLDAFIELVSTGEDNFKESHGAAQGPENRRDHNVLRDPGAGRHNAENRRPHRVVYRSHRQARKSDI
jgi:hypothetical protein